MPKELGIFEQFDIDCRMTVDSIAERVVQNREKLMEKVIKKTKSQNEYYEKKEHIAEV